MIDHSIDWFIQRDKEDNKLQNVEYSGSFGTSPVFGIFSSGDIYLPIFEYKVEALIVNDREAESTLRAESSVKIHRISGVEQISPVREIKLIGITEENLNVIKNWLDNQFIKYQQDCCDTRHKEIMPVAE